MISLKKTYRTNALSKTCHVHGVCWLHRAFDTVNRFLLWAILQKIGYPERFVNLVASLHTNMKSQVRFKGDLSDAFEINNDVKQGCALAPTLYSIFLSLVLHHASLIATEEYRYKADQAPICLMSINKSLQELGKFSAWTRGCWWQNACGSCLSRHLGDYYPVFPGCQGYWTGNNHEKQKLYIKPYQDLITKVTPSY